jgi:hypothetical protein
MTILDTDYLVALLRGDADAAAPFRCLGFRFGNPRSMTYIT